MFLKPMPLLALACAVAALTGCETTNMKMGSAESKTVATGAAGGATTTLTRCGAEGPMMLVATT